MSGDPERAILDEMAGWGRPAYWLALRATGRPELAEDAVQEAYVQAMGALDRLGADAASARVRFLGLVANRARNEIRAEARRRRREKAVETSRPPDGRAAELASDARAALGRLEEDLRLPVHLCCEQGLSQREAAAVLDVPERTLSRRVAEGLEKLRRMLGAAGAGAAPAMLLGAGGELGPPMPAALAAKINAVLGAKAAGAAGAVPAGAAASAKATAATVKLGLLAKIGISLAVAGLIAGAAGVFYRSSAPTARPRILWIGSGSTSSLMASAESLFESGGSIRPRQEMCGQFFRIDHVSKWKEAGETARVEKLMASLKRAIAAKQHDYIGVQVSGAIFREPAGEKHVAALLDEVCGLIAASGTRPLLFEHWSTNPEKMRQYCLEAARRHRGRVVLRGSAGDEARAADGRKYFAEGGEASPLGHYLGACCLYATLTGRSPEGLPLPKALLGTEVRLGPGKRRPITREDVQRMQRAAWETYKKYSTSGRERR